MGHRAGCTGVRPWAAAHSPEARQNGSPGGGRGERATCRGSTCDGGGVGGVHGDEGPSEEGVVSVSGRLASSKRIPWLPAAGKEVRRWDLTVRGLGREGGHRRGG
uniref:Uncharacterized protein n=1 Tax=Arundo donax TaxID=35708 RepID=A0A0A9CML3_ARUDO